MLREQNSRLRESIDEQEKKRLTDCMMTGKKLGYFKKFLKREDYNKVIEMGKDNEKNKTQTEIKQVKNSGVNTNNSKVKIKNVTKDFC